MAKSSSNKRKQASQPASAHPHKKPAAVVSAAAPASTPAENDDDTLLAGLLYPDELEASIDVLRTLAANPELMKIGSTKSLNGGQVKAFKSAMWDCWRAMGEVSGTGSSLTSRISTTLSNGQHLESLVLLSELRLRRQVPKLGSLQRWVRECDAASVAAEQKKDAGKGKARSLKEQEEEEEMLWAVLDAILRACTGVGEVQGGSDGVVETDVQVGKKGVRRWSSFDAQPLLAGSSSSGSIDRSPARFWSQVQSHTLLSAEEKSAFLSGVHALDTTPGPSRRPPNLYPAIVQHLPAATDHLLAFDAARTGVVQKFDVPGVPGARLLTDVMSRDECRLLVGMSEAVGMIEDTPVAGSAAELNSVLAHNLILLAPPPLIDVLFARMRDLLPQTVPVPKGSKASGHLKGINRRFRIYRYGLSSVYRPHVDGAWPSSAETGTGANGEASKYIYDSDSTVYSRFTCLFYLNDSFTKGETTFFVPDPLREGVLDARPVKPLMGAALVFPHGATEGSLLHEGSAVFPNEIEGAKYVIRTEILYEVERLAGAGEGGVVGGLV